MIPVTAGVVLAEATENPKIVLPLIVRASAVDVDALIPRITWLPVDPPPMVMLLIVLPEIFDEGTDPPTLEIPVNVPIAEPVIVVKLLLLIVFPVTVQMEVESVIPLNVQAKAPPAIVLPVIVLPVSEAVNVVELWPTAIAVNVPVLFLVLLDTLLPAAVNVAVAGEPDKLIPVKVPVPLNVIPFTVLLLAV